MADDDALSTPVAIVGGGPVGLVLALFLDFYGVKSTVFNTEPNERWHPKGNGQNARTMEHYRRLGFSDPEVDEWCRAAGLEPAPPRHLPGDPLTVTIWAAYREPSARGLPAPALRNAGTRAAPAERMLHG